MSYPAKMKKPIRVYEYEVEHLLLQADHDRARCRLAQRGALPDLDAIYNSRLLRPVLFRLQQLIWTLRSWRARHAREAGPVVERSSQGEQVVVNKSAGNRLIYLDITASQSGKVTGGIRTVAQALAGAATRSGAATPVVVFDGVVRTYESGRLGDRVQLQAGDVFAILDHYWEAAYWSQPAFMILFRWNILP